MIQSGFEADDEPILFSDTFTEHEGGRLCAELLNPRREFTAIVAANDLVALGCYESSRRAASAARAICPPWASTTCPSLGAATQR